MFKHRFILLLVITFSVAMLTVAQENFPDAPITNPEGGPTVVTGEVTYTNPFFTSGVAAPIIILEDQAGFIDRNEYFVFPPESQTLGQITSDFYTSPFDYSLALPIEPQGTLRDVDNDGEEDLGVMVFAIAYWNNVWGDPFLEERDLYGGGWSTAYASTEVSTDPSTDREIIGGSFIIYAPDEQQGFPTNFGEDGLLFTEDDPIVSVPQGYTIVDMDTDPFTFDRTSEPVIDLLEPESAALIDYGGQSYTEAFDNMVELFRTEYAFTEYKGINWDALVEQTRPLFVEAQQTGDSQLYFEGLRQFLWSIPDGHVAFTPFTPLIDNFRFDIARGIGIGLSETDTGEVIVTYLLENGPAADAGVELGAEILELGGMSVQQAITETVPWNSPFSTKHNLRLAQLRYVTRFDADTGEVQIAYRNPGSEDVVDATMPTSNETGSFNETNSFVDRGPFELPVEYELLESGYGYVTIAGFTDNSLLTIQLWERMITEMKEFGVPGIIIDMRQNGGGSGFLADQMSAYFFDEPQVLGSRGSYSEELGTFYFDPRSEQRMYLPAEELRYLDDVVVLVGPNCASACERFAYNFTIGDRGAIIGQYPTAGLGGSVNDFRMPEGVTVRFTTGRSVNADGKIHIEGIGVIPSVRVPITRETLFSSNDTVLDYAIDYINQ
jgi:C-terminal processing protease CtpA/Prc